ncbi:unnamed protein product [Callosobruchus maculatus]|uniref:C2H2-type domain-containing protein n=1 Tax=Callosobruchus maculatus TaxID=64391 RepID=A0A653CG42_CALMS|nr:unnamed protein product [Callosobruchus maculatus]
MKGVECHRCKKILNCRSTLNRHIRSVHQESPPVTTYLKESCSFSHHCLEEDCDNAFATNKALIEHLTVNHNKEFQTEYLLMDDVEVFQAWKSKIERETDCYYVSKGKSSSSNGKSSYYYCNRSKTGYMKKERRSRNEKSQGSCKLDYSCTSQIKMTQEEMGIVVEWQKVHYGHTRDLRHLRLSKAEKQYIVSKLRKGETPASLVQSFQKQTKDHLRRMHLLTVSGIRRIQRECRIKSEELVDNKQQQNREEAMNFWEESVFSGEQQDEDTMEDNINNGALGNESIYEDQSSICDPSIRVKEELDPDGETSNNQIIYGQDVNHNFNSSNLTDQERCQANPEVTVFDTKPALVIQVRDMLSNLSGINFEDLPGPVLSQVQRHLTSMTELLGLSEINVDKKIDSLSVVKVCKKDYSGDVEGKAIQAPEDSIILIVEDDSKNSW